MKVVTREQFLESEAGQRAQYELEKMVDGIIYKTQGTRINMLGDPETFVERHITYLVKHPDVNPLVYLSNLRVMTKIKR